MAKRKTRKKVIKKVVYKIKQPVPTLNSSKIKSEIQELEEKRKKSVEGKTGLKKFFAGALYTREINERKRLINQGAQLQKIRQQTELEKAKNELVEVRKKRVEFNKISGIKLEDLYR